MIQWLDSAFELIATAINVLCGVVLCLMSLHIAADVIGRYLFNAPLGGTIEIVSRYYMVSLVFLPLPYIQFRRRHFAATLFTDRLSPGALRIILLLGDAAAALLAGLVAWQSAITAMEKTSAGEHIETASYLIMSWPARWAVAIGFALMCVAACLCLANDVLRPLQKREAAKVSGE